MGGRTQGDAEKDLTRRTKNRVFLRMGCERTEETGGGRDAAEAEEFREGVAGVAGAAGVEIKD
jgi:hypothetical protein